LEEKAELQNRLDNIEQICVRFLNSNGFPSKVLIKYVIDIARGENKDS